MPSSSVPPGGPQKGRPSATKPAALWWVLGALTLLAIAYAGSVPFAVRSYARLKRREATKGAPPAA